MVPKIVTFFTAGSVATSEEKTQIANLNGLVGSHFEVRVANALADHNYGYGPRETDFVAGTRPTAYTNTETYPAFNTANPPVQVSPTQKVIAHGQVLTLAAGAGTVNVSIVAGVATYTFVAP